MNPNPALRLFKWVMFLIACDCGLSPAVSELERPVAVAQLLQEGENSWQPYFALDGSFRTEAQGTRSLEAISLQSDNPLSPVLYTSNFQVDSQQWQIATVDLPNVLTAAECEVFFAEDIRSAQERGRLLFQEKTLDCKTRRLRFGLLVDEGQPQARSVLFQVQFTGRRRYVLIRISDQQLKEWDSADRLLNSFVATTQSLDEFRSAQEFVQKHGFGEETLLRSLLLQKQSKLNEAEALLRVLAMEASITPGIPETQGAVFQGQLGNILLQQQKYEEAIFHFQSALAIRHRHDPTSNAVVQHCEQIALTLRDISRFTEAVRFHQAALQAVEQTQGSHTRAFADGLWRLATTLRSARDWSSAQQTASRSLAKFRVLLQEEKISDSERPSVDQTIAGLLNLLGSVHTQLNQFDEARPLLQQAREAHLGSHGEDSLQVAISDEALGQLELAVGNPTAARELFEKVLQVYLTTLGPDHPTTLESRRSFATALTDIGDLVNAKDQLLQVLAGRRRIFESPDQAIAAVLNDLAGVCRLQGNTAESLQYLTEAFDIDKTLLGEGHPHSEVVLHNLGTMQLESGHLDAAEQAYQAAIQSIVSGRGTHDPLLRMPLQALAMVAVRRGDLTAAEDHLNAAETLITQRMPERHPAVTELKIQQAELRERQERFSDALRLHHAARELHSQYINHQLMALPDFEQQQFLATQHQPALQAAVGFALRNTNLPEVASKAAEWLINGKAVAAEVSARRLKLERLNQNPQFVETAEQLRAVRSELARWYLDGAEGFNSSNSHAFRQLEIQEQRLSRILATAGIRRSSGAPWVTLAELQQHLPPDSAFIDIFQLPADQLSVASESPSAQPSDQSDSDGRLHYVCLITSSENAGSARIVDLGPVDPVDRQIDELRRMIQAAFASIRDGNELSAEEEFSVAASRLTERLLRPILEVVPDTDNFVVSPDGMLWLLPWDALVLPDGSYAVERFSFQFVLSGRDLVPVRTTQDTSDRSSSSPLLVADPDFDGGLESPVTESTAAGLRTTAPRRLLPRVARLPGTRLEAAAVTQNLTLYAQSPPMLLTGEHATEATVRSVAGPSVVVLCTHGFFLTDEAQAALQQSIARKTRLLNTAVNPRGVFREPLLRCGLMLAGCNQDHGSLAGQDDGILSGLEILGMDLTGTRLVVLSACDTGVGSLQASEGVAGLRQAFSLAGAECVVATLWQVSDNQTASLMSSFFRHLANGQAVHVALRTARLEQLEARRRRFGAAHPFFWASVMATGGLL